MIQRFNYLFFARRSYVRYMFSTNPQNKNQYRQTQTTNNTQKHNTQSKQQQKINNQNKTKPRKMIYQALVWGTATVLGYHIYLVAQQQNKPAQNKNVVGIPGLTTVAELLYNGFNQATQYFTSPSRQKLLPDIKDPNKYPKTLVLNLSGTIVDIQSKNSKGITFKKRPGLHQFLRKMSQFYEVVIFSQEDQQVLSQIVNRIDPRTVMINEYLGHECMVFSHGRYIKDLKYLNRDPSKIIVIDKSKDIVAKHKQNVLTLSTYKGDDDDRQLIILSNLLQRLARPEIKDVRKYLQQLGQNPMQKFKQKLKQQQQKQQQNKEQKIKQFKNNRGFNFFTKKSDNI